MIYLKALAELIPLLVEMCKRLIAASDRVSFYFEKKAALLEYAKADKKAGETKDTSDLENLFRGGTPPRA